MLYVSIHIPKTAGTSFAKALAEAWAPGEFFADYQHERDHARLVEKGVAPLDTHSAWLTAGLPQIAWRYRRDRCHFPKATTLVHGHFPWRKYHPLLTWRKTFYIVWIRDPFARAVSNYYYWQLFDPETVRDPLVKLVLEEKWSLEDFLFHPAMRDYQTMTLSGLPRNRIDFIGVTEHFSEDLACLSRKIGRPFAPHVENVGHAAKAMVSNTHLRARFAAYHDQDTELYRYAQRLRGRA